MLQKINNKKIVDKIILVKKVEIIIYNKLNFKYLKIIYATININ